MSSWPDTRNSLILRLATSSDAVAWAEFERTYQPAIYRYARFHALSQTDAMDVVQEVLLVVHKRVADWQPNGQVGSFRKWLSETARRVTLHQLRLRQRFQPSEGNLIDGISSNDFEDQSRREEDDDRRWQFYCAAAVVEAQVTPQHWRVFWMTAVEGQSAESVAAQLTMKVGTVYSIRCRIQARIRDALNVSAEPGGGDA